MFADVPSRFLTTPRLDHLLAEFDRLAEAVSGPGLPVAVWGTDDAVLVVADVPGVAKADLSIEASSDTLTISGRRTAEAPRSGDQWIAHERTDGAFSRTIQLPWRVDPDRIEARLVNGQLSIALVRAEADKPRRINVAA